MKRIYLQVTDEWDEPQDILDGSVTWCEDRQHKGDVEYVRADEVAQLEATLDRSNKQFGELYGKNLKLEAENERMSGVEANLLRKLAFYQDAQHLRLKNRQIGDALNGGDDD
jgi:hypothetical protein